MKTCKLCDKPVLCKDLCRAHYDQDYRRQRNSNYVSLEELAARNKDILRLAQEGYSRKELAVEFGLSLSQVYLILIKLGFRSELRVIGCDKCETDEYARGLCKACYQRWIYRGKPDLAIIQPKMVAWQKQGGHWPEERLKPIGCEECQRNPRAKGLCRRCYNRQWARRNRREKN